VSSWESVVSVRVASILSFYHEDFSVPIPNDTVYGCIEFWLTHRKCFKKIPAFREDFQISKKPYEIVGKRVDVLVPSCATIVVVRNGFIIEIFLFWQDFPYFFTCSVVSQNT